MGVFQVHPRVSSSLFSPDSLLLLMGKLFLVQLLIREWSLGQCPVSGSCFTCQGLLGKCCLVYLESLDPVPENSCKTKMNFPKV